VAGSDGRVTIRADLNFVGDVDNVLIGAGGLTASYYYQYMLTYVDINGYESEPNYGEVMQMDAGTLEEHVILNVGVAEIGANGAKNNPDIKFRRLYRTAGQVASFTANTLPFKLVVEEDIRHDEPLVFLSGDALQYRIFDDLSDARLGDTYAEVNKTAKSAIVWSQVDRPSYMLAEDIKSIFRDDQDEITGILDDGNGVLIFKENSIIKLYHTGASENWYIRKVWSEFGCDEPKSLIKAGDIIYFRYRNRPYAFRSGSAPQYIGYGKQTFLDTVTVRDVAVTDQWIMWMVEDSSDFDYLAIYDKVVKSWYQFHLSANPSFYGLKTIMVKRYDDFWTKGNIYIGHDEIFEYTKNTYVDDFSGSATFVTSEIQLPRIKLDSVTKARIRDIVMYFLRHDPSAVILIGIDTDSDSYSPVSLPTGEGLKRVGGWGGKVPATYFDITLTGGLKQLDAVRIDLRPTRRGTGSI
jgi:hypothetical protein